MPKATESATEQQRATPEARRHLRELVHWLKGDLFERADPPADVNAETTLCFKSPLGWTVLMSLRRDGSGYSGEVRKPDGDWVSTTSWVEIPWLDEKLP